MLSYCLSLSRGAAAVAVAQWLKQHVYWWGTWYSSWYLVTELAVQGITGVWDTDFDCLSLMS